MSKVLKNTTNLDIELIILGRTIPSNGQLIVDNNDFQTLGLPESILELAPLLSSGSIVANDGANDLSPELGLALIQSSYVKVADNVLQSDRIKVDVVGALTDGRVIVSTNDSSSAVLEDKIVAENNKISIQTINEGMDEDIQIGINPENIGTSELNNDEGFLNETSHDSLPQDNPHNVNKIQVGLGNVDNTSDADKPISTAQQNALDLKYNASNPNGYETPAELDVRDTANRDRSNHTGTQLSNTISDFTTAVQTAETDTTLQLIGNTLRYVGETGINQDIDLSLYLDDTNLARIVSGTLNETTGEVTFTRDDSSTFTIDFSSLLSVNVDIENEVYVAKNGNDTTGDGTLGSPFLTVKQALDFISTQSPSSSNPFCVKIGPGIYNEDPMTCPEFVIINGCGPRTRIVANNANSDLLTMSPNSSLRGLSFQGVTGASNFCVVFSASSGGVASFIDLFFVACSNAMKLVNSSGLLSSSGSNLLAAAFTGVLVEVNSNTRFTLQGASVNGNTTTSEAFNFNGDGQGVVYNVRATDCNVVTRASGTGEINLTQLEAQNSNIPLIQSSTSTIIINGGDFDARTVQVNSVDTIQGYFINRLDDEVQLRVNSELSVGLPSVGRESAFGQGDSYRNGMLVYTFDGSSFNNVSDTARQDSGIFGFPNTNANSAIYVSTAFPAATPLSFFGFKANTTTAAVLGSGEIVSEYWDGSNWVEFNTMSEGEVGTKYQKYSTNLFQRAASEQIYFDDSIEQDWQPNDPVSLGLSFRWVRFRIDSNISTAPEFSTFKIHTNRTKINSDGFIQYFGKGRRYKQLSSDIVFEAASNSPSNQDIYLSDNLPVGKRENEFFTGGSLFSSDQSGSVFKIPGDLDTSCKLKVNITYVSDDTGTARFFLYWNNSSEGDSIFQSEGDAPSESSGERQVLIEDLYSTNEVQKTVTQLIEIPEAIPRDQNQKSDILWVGLRISNSSTVDPIVLVNFSIEYVSNESGDYL